MAKIIYKELSNELLLVESRNLMNEIKAFMNHDIISARKINELSSRVYEINGELNVRGAKEPQDELSLTMLSRRIELAEMLIKLNEHNKESKPQPQPQ